MALVIPERPLLAAWYDMSGPERTTAVSVYHTKYGKFVAAPLAHLFLLDFVFAVYFLLHWCNDISSIQY